MKFTVLKHKWKKKKSLMTLCNISVLCRNFFKKIPIKKIEYYLNTFEYFACTAIVKPHYYTFYAYLYTYFENKNLKITLNADFKNK